MLSPDPGVRVLLSNDLAVQDLEHSMRKILQIDIMGDHDQSYFLCLVQFQQDIKDNVRVPRIQISCRLIQEQNLRFVGQRSGNSHSLLFSTRQLVWIMFQPVTHSH